MLPVKGAYRQAAKKSEDTLLRVTSSRLPIGGARKLCRPSGEHRSKPLGYSSGGVQRQAAKEDSCLSREYKGKPSRRILSLPVGGVRKPYFLSKKHRGEASIFALRFWPTNHAE